MTAVQGPAPYTYPPDAETVNDLRRHIVTALNGFAAPAELVADSWVRERSELVLTVRGHQAAGRLAAELGLTRSGGMTWTGRWEGLHLTVSSPVPGPATRTVR